MRERLRTAMHCSGAGSHAAVPKLLKPYQDRLQLVMQKDLAKSVSTSNGHLQPSSRKRFEHYRDLIKQKELPAGGYHSTVEPPSNRIRSAAQLVWQFFRLLIPYRWQTFFILLSAAT